MLTSAELIVGAVTVEVVTLAVFATVDLCRILPLLAFAGAADTVAIVATDICAIVFSAVGIQVLCPDFVFTTLADTPNTPFITPDRKQEINHFSNNVLLKLNKRKKTRFNRWSEEHWSESMCANTPSLIGPCTIQVQYPTSFDSWTLLIYRSSRLYGARFNRADLLKLNGLALTCTLHTQRYHGPRCTLRCWALL